MNLVFLFLITYFMLGTIIAILSRRFGIKNIYDYYIAGGRMSRLLAFGTYAATTYSAFMMIGLVGLTYKTGVGALGFELLYLASTVYLLSTIGFKIWNLSKTKGWISPSEMVGGLYGSNLLSNLLSLIYLVAIIPYLSAQIQGIGILLEKSGLEYKVGILIGSFIILLWMSIGGMWSVASTDLFQAIWMLAGGMLYLTWLLSYTKDNVGDLNIIIDMVGKNGYLGLTNFWTFSVFLAYTIPWIFFALTNPQVVTRLFIHRDMHSYKASITYFSVYGLLYTVLSILIGLFARGLSLTGVLPELKREDVTPFLITQMNPVLSSFIVVSIISAAISTGNSIILAVASSIQRDLLRKTSETRKPILLSISIQLLLISVASIITLNKNNYILDLSVMTSVMLLPQAPLVIYGVLASEKKWFKPKKGATIALLTGFITSLYYSFKLGPRGAFLASINGLPLSLLVISITTITLFLSIVIEAYSYKNKKNQ